MASPEVSVLMCVYNGEKYLAEAIESILNQTFRDFEFIIIDDGSTDGTAAILDRYQQIDNRIQVYKKKQGLVASRNWGCHLAKGKYIAVMDADDVSLPERLAIQTHYMETHPEIGVLGTWVQTIDENGHPLTKWRLPTSPRVLGWSLILFPGCLAHSSIMMRRNIIKRVGFYNPEMRYAHDYELWSRVKDSTQLANIPHMLLRYRIWEGNITSRHLQTQQHYATKVTHSMITGLLGSEIPLETVSSLRRILSGLPLDNPQQVDHVTMLILRLYRAYLDNSSLSRAEAREVAHDAGIKLLTLAASTTKLSLQKRLSILARALRLNPRLLWSRQIITKGLRKGSRILWGGT